VRPWNVMASQTTGASDDSAPRLVLVSKHEDAALDDRLGTAAHRLTEFKSPLLLRRAQPESACAAAVNLSLPESVSSSTIRPKLGCSSPDTRNVQR
jgi:hypothetical protein